MELTALDSLACGRGDGLVPELRALLESLAARRACERVVELDLYRPEPLAASGPHRPAAAPSFRDGVLAFPGREAIDNRHPDSAPARRGM